MSKKVTTVILAAVLALPALASAKDLTGRFGLGYHNTDAPIGVRYWVNPKLGLDFGVGFESQDVGAKNAMSYFLEAGLPYVIVGNDHANFFVRPGVQYASLDDRAYGSMSLDESWTRVRFAIEPGAEVFFGDHFSLQASYGLGYEYLSAPDAYNTDALTSYGTFGNSITNLGFHFYF